MTTLGEQLNHIPFPPASRPFRQLDTFPAHATQSSESNDDTDRMRRTLIAALLLAALAARAKDAIPTERIWLDIRINNKPARLIFDSGSSCSALTPKTVQRLGLKTRPCLTNEVPPGTATTMTEELPVIILGREAHIKFAVMTLPDYTAADCDGLIGWWDVSGGIIHINTDDGKIELLERLPKQISKFTRLALTNCGTLDFQIPNPDGTNRVLCTDTGFPTGAALPAARWRGWRQTHPHNPSTLGWMFSPSDGFFLFEESWADEVHFGTLQLSQVPVMTAGPGNVSRYGPQYAGTLGFTALRQLDLIIDGPAGQAYIRPKRVRTRTYQHNRLGAIFVPTNAHTNHGIARVIEGSPAFEAGIRNGDRLLQLDGIQVRSWTADWLNKLGMPAGTKLSLTLERNNTNFTTSAILRDIVTANPAGHK